MIDSVIGRTRAVLCALLILGLSACTRGGSSGSGTGKYTIAVVPMSSVHEFWSSIHAGAVKAARELNVDIIWKAPQINEDREKQIALLESLVVRAVDGMVLAPVDAVSLKQAIESTVDHPGPVYFRLGRGRETPVYEGAVPGWAIGGSAQVHDGDDATVFATGVCVTAALQAATELAKEGAGLRVIDMYSLKPLDRQAVHRAASETRRLLSAEEHNVIGGLGSAVSEVLAESGLASPLCRIGIPDEYSLVGPPTHLYRHYGIDADGIARAVRRVLGGE